MTFEEAWAIINQNPDGIYVARINGEFITLSGHAMKGFLLPSDTLEYFKEFK